MKTMMLKGFSLLMLLAFVICLISCDVEKYNKYNKQINLNVDLDEKIELNALFPNSGMDNSSFANGWTTKYFEEKTGYKVNYSQAIDNQQMNHYLLKPYKFQILIYIHGIALEQLKCYS